MRRQFGERFPRHRGLVTPLVSHNVRKVRAVMYAGIDN